MKLKTLLILSFILFILFTCKKSYHTTDNNKNLEKTNTNEDIPRELSMIITGFEPPFKLPDTRKDEIYYDILFNDIFIVNKIVPEKKIYIELIDPENIQYSKEILVNDKNYKIYTNDPDTNENLQRPVIEVPIFNYSCFNSGLWKIKVIFDDGNKTLLENKLNIQMKNLSLNSKKDLTPFEENNIQHFSDNNDLYFYGNNEKPNKEIIVAFYLITNKFNLNNENILELEYYTPVKTDNKGKYLLILNSNKLKKGSYKIATGEKRKLKLNYFDVWFSID